MLKALGRIYFAAIFVGLLVALVAVGTPPSAFIRLFVVIGAVAVVKVAIPAFIEHGLPIFLRGRPDSEVERIQTRAGVGLWVSVFIVAPVVANLFFGVDVPVPGAELVLIAGLLAIVWLVGRRRGRASKPRELHAEPRVGDGLFPGVTLIARPIAWALDRREATRRAKLLAAGDGKRPRSRR